VELATRIARNAHLAVAAFERAVTERTAFGDQEAFRQQDRIVAPVLTSEDAREGGAPSPRNAHPTGRAAEIALPSSGGSLTHFSRFEPRV
jgi:hypothetical protein